jgi:hypothetical protein
MQSVYAQATTPSVHSLRVFPFSAYYAASGMPQDEIGSPHAECPWLSSFAGATPSRNWAKITSEKR